MKGDLLSARKRKKDPTRYDAQCKDCKRSVSSKVLADPSYIPPNAPNYSLHPKAVESRAYRKQIKKQKAKLNRKSASENKRAIRIKTRIKVMEYKSKKGCCKCGERDPRVLEFDHIDPTKKKHMISRLLSDGYGWASNVLRKEIRKCRILCANCHRKHTIEQQDYYKSDDVRAALKRILGEHDIGRTPR